MTKQPSDSMARQPGGQLLKRQCATLTCHLATVLEQDQARDRPNAKLRRQLLIGLAVQLGKPHTPAQLRSGLLERWRKGFARPTPIRPYIHQQWQLALDLAGVITLGQVERLAQQHRLLAAPALGLIAKPVGRNAVEAVAVGAGDQQGLGHDGYRKRG